MSPPPTRPNFYRYSSEQKSLDDYVQTQIEVRLDERRSSLIDERNVHRYRHGNRWTTTSAEPPSKMRSMAAESTIHTLDVINHDTAILEQNIETMVEQLYANLMKNIYDTVGEAAEQNGNTITRKDHHGDIPLGFLTMLEKIEFGVDRHGSAQRPLIHMAAEQAQKFIKALQDQPDHYHLKIETTSRKKENDAIAREAERISRFRWK